MDFLEAVEAYFRGERHVGLALIPVGIALVCAAAYLFYVYQGSFGKAMAVVLAIAGLGGAIGGGFLVRTVNARQERLTSEQKVDAAAPIAAERARIEKVNRNWPLLKATWAALTVVALVVLIFVKRDWAQGVALALICLCAFALVVDSFAERRAFVYAERIAPPGG